MEINKKLTTTLTYRPSTVRISTNILNLLGNPKYIVLMINTDSHQIAYFPSTKADRSALKVRYDGSVSYNGKVVNSCRFVRKVYSIENWDINYRYHMKGFYVEEANIVYFDLKKAEPVKRNRVNNEDEEEDN